MFSRFFTNPTHYRIWEYFYKKIEHLVTNLYALLDDTFQKLDFNEVKNRIQLLTRNGLLIFPNISMELEKLEPYLPQPPYTCLYCPDGRIFNDIYSLENHINWIHKKLTEIWIYCNEEWSWSSLSTHIKRIHEQRKEQCPFCSWQYIYGTLYIHIRIVDEQRKVQCSLCPRLVSEGTLKTHIIRIHEKRKKSWPICHKLISVDHISAHIQNIHNKRIKIMSNM